MCFVLTFVFGILDPERGFTVAPLLFWVGLLIGTTALQAICRGVWTVVDPWATLQDLLQLDARRALKAPPWWLGPLSIYALFWFELVSGKGFDPIAIITVMLGYTLYVLSFKNTFGDAWEEADPLSILFGFAGRSAPLAVTEEGIAYKGFLADLDDENPMPLALFASVFVLLGSTTLDNVRETVQWGDFLINSGLDAVPDDVDGLGHAAALQPAVLPAVLRHDVAGRPLVAWIIGHRSRPALWVVADPDRRRLPSGAQRAAVDRGSAADRYPDSRSIRARAVWWIRAFAEARVVPRDSDHRWRSCDRGARGPPHGRPHFGITFSGGQESQCIDGV